LSLFSELKRRNVFRVTAGYVVLSWLLLQVADLLTDMLGLPEVWGKAVLGLLLIGIVPVVIFAWVYEMTPEGLKRESDVSPDASITVETGYKLNVAIIFLLVVAIGVYSLNNFVLSSRSQPTAGSKDQATEVAAESTSLPVIAVLPLQALSAESEGQFLAAGLHDDLLTRLARLQAFRVISRTSVMEYANTTKNMREIGAELGAGYILEGGLQAIGGNVRINAQLIDASTDEHLWAETYDRELTTANLFDVQGDIAGAIANAMHSTLSPQEEQQISSAPTDNLEAYEAFLRGRANSGILTQPAIEAAVDSFAEAVELDPLFAEAWSHLSVSFSRKYWETGAEDGIGADPSVRAAALDALKRAQELAPGAVTTLVAEGYYYYYGFRDYTRALEVTARALAIAPNDLDVTSLQTFLSRRLGRVSDAADGMIEILQMDPNSSGQIVQVAQTLVEAHRCSEAKHYANILQDRFAEDVESDLVAAIVSFNCDHDFGAARNYALQIPVTTFQQMGYVSFFLTLAGDFDGAIDVLLENRDTLGDQPTVRLWIENRLARLYRETGQNVRADAALQNAIDIVGTIESPGSTALQEFAHTAALRGDAEETYALGQALLENLPDDAFRYPDFAISIAVFYVNVGLLDEALDLLVETSANYTFEQEMTFDYVPVFEPLRKNPRFRAMVESVEVY
jgi:TolB-like protein